MSPLPFSSTSPSTSAITQAGICGASPSTQSTGSSDPPEQHQARISLACYRCRAKRGRCTGERPVCAPCAKVSAECTWPEGRRKKRSRREMESEEGGNEVGEGIVSARTQGQAYARGMYAEQTPMSVSPSHSGRQQDVDIRLSPVEHHISPHHQAIAWRVTTNTNTTHIHPTAHLPSPHLPSPSDAPFGAIYPHGYPRAALPPPPHPSHPQQQPQPQPQQPQQPDTASIPPLPAGYMPLQSDPPTIPRRFAQGYASQTQAQMHGHAPCIERSRSDESQATDGDLELFYYRFSGPPGSTAVAPGINRISLRLQLRAGPTDAPMPARRRSSETPPRPETMFEENGMPLAGYYIPLLDLFFKTVGRHFPSVSKKRMDERLETGTMSAFLMNCICAVSARFADGESDPSKACQPFITKAQELLIPLLHLPTNDVATGLLLLSWACYGQNSDAGLWQYSGMAIRMAIDLGIHEISEIYESSAHVVRTRLFCWSLFVTDRILALYTGRLPSIPEDVIEIPLPTDEDFYPDTNDPTSPSSSTSTNPHIHGEIEPIPFNYLVRLMIICGRIATVLNGRRGRPRTLVPAEPGSASSSSLSGLQSELVRFYAGLPESLRWSAETFKRQEDRNHGTTFVTLHLWANAIMALTYHPELTASAVGMETPLSKNMERSAKVAISCARTIAECVRFSDIFAQKAYVTSPFCVQPIFIASLAFIHDAKAMPLILPQIGSERESTPTTTTADTLLKNVAQQNLTTLGGALKRMDHYWAGIAYVSGVLEQKAAALGYPINKRSKEKRTFVPLRDQGLLRRFTGTDLPYSTAPATETSLWNSMAKEALEQHHLQQQNASFSMAGILSAYDIEELMVQPVGTFDLERFLAM